ncbi:hypothetical protein ROTAS13_04612 [Roseomonas sp. TAS13]|nr:hypothetical protein ROTAS13_04612 [Roseomonas sp. TAS13]
MLLVVMEALTSIITGSPPVGKPKAKGAGESVPFTPPKGATEAAPGAEEWIESTSPRSATRCR